MRWLDRLTLAVCRAFVRVTAVLVPGGRRGEWRREWEAELAARSSDALSFSRADLVRRSLGALPHAFWIRRLEWSFVMTDVRYALRLVIRQPLFALVIVGTLSLGIGGATAMFSIVHGVLLKPLPYADPDRLVWMFGAFRLNDSAAVSPPDFLDYRARQETFESMAAMMIAPSGVTVATADGPERLQATRTTGGMLTTLGVRPALGRDLEVGDESLSAPQVALISHRLWRQRFGDSPDVIGRTLVVDRRAHEIVGVLPAGFELPLDPFVRLDEPLDLLLPFPFDAPESRVRRFHFLRAIGRLRPDQTLAGAQGQMDVIARQLESVYPENETWRLRLLPLHERLVGQSRPALLMLMAAVGLVLLIACANVTSLLLARATTRAAEIAVRTALGASLGRLVRQLFIEGLVLALLGAAAGLVLSTWLIGVVKQLAPGAIPRLAGVGLDPAVVGFALLTACGATLMFSLVPAWRAARPGVGARMQEGTRGSDGAGRARLRQALVAGQVALSVTLLVGAGLLARSFARLQAVDVGFATDVLLAPISLPPETYDSVDKADVFFTALAERLPAVPGVEAAALATTPPLVGGNDTSVHREGRAPASQADRQFAQIRWIQGNYFGALAIPLLQGRAFDDRADAPGTAPVAVISRRMADRFFPGENALGQRVVIDLREPVTAEVVGIAADARVFGQASEPPALLYLSSRQFPTNFMNIVVRSAASPAAVTAPLRRAVQELDPTLALARVESMRDLLSESVAQPRLRTWLIAAFACVALLLTLIGLYGILAFSVSRRTKEIGIRLALGASDRQVVAMILTQGALLVGIGTAAGLLLALWAGRLLSTLLFEVPPNDPLVFAAVAVALAASGLIAAAVPARRAARIEPVRALRTE